MIEEIDCYDLRECPGSCDEACTILTETCCLRFLCGDGEHALSCPKRRPAAPVPAETVADRIERALDAARRVWAAAAPGKEDDHE